MLQDCKDALRLISKNWGFTAIVALTLGLGIGANTAIFTVINKVLLQPLPYRDPSQLVLLQAARTGGDFGTLGMSAPDFLDYRDQSQSFDYLAAISGIGMNLSGAVEPVRVEGTRVSSNFFPMLGVNPLKGRYFLPEDERTGADRIVILSFGLWSTTFGSDENIFEKKVLLDGESYSVAGVMPPDFRPPFARADIWVPFSVDLSKTTRDTRYIRVIGRLKPDVSLQSAESELASLAARLEREYPQTNTKIGVKLSSLHSFLIRNAKTTIPVLLGAVAFVLLIACANVTNLLLARGGARRKEMLIRTALGASRARIIKQLLTESLFLSLAGTIIGILLAHWGTRLLATSLPDFISDSIPALKDLSLNWTVLLATIFLSALAAVIFGLAPALRISAPNLSNLVRESGVVSDRGGMRLGGLLVVLEITLTLVLLTGAGLMIKSFYKLVGGDQGFNPEGLITMRLSLPASKYREAAQVRTFIDNLIEKSRSTPLVQSAAVISEAPFSNSNSSTVFAIEDRPGGSPADRPIIKYHSAGVGFFKVFGLPLLEGVDFSDVEREDSQRVVIINKRAAERIWQGESPIGKRIRFDRRSVPWCTIVGVVGNVKHSGQDNNEEPEAYFPISQLPVRNLTLVVRTTSDTGSVASAIREVVLAEDPDQPLYDIQTMEQAISDWAVSQRLTSWLLGVFAFIAMALAATGVYGVMSYSVAQRTKEIGLRMALGAGRLTLLRMFLYRGARITLVGIVVGVAGAFLFTKAMSALLYDVQAFDPQVFVAVSAMIALIAVIAILIPAYRATKVDPMEALRQD